VVGISGSDGDATLARFRAERSLPFAMVADPGGHIARSFGVGRSWLGGVQRVTFVVERGGRIKAALEHSLLVGKHVQGALEALGS
jgi:peroxiredoxin